MTKIPLLESFHSRLKDLLNRLDSTGVSISPFMDGYLVGGCLRDILAGVLLRPARPAGGDRETEVRELDIILPGDIHKRAKAFADNIRGSLFALDEERVVWRVLKRIGGETWRLDFSGMRGEKILADLRLRDFSINALAIGVNDLLKKGKKCKVIDPCNGIRDIKVKRIRAVKDDVFICDPLRMLRAVRLSFQLRFSIEPETLRLIKKDASYIQRVSSERVRDEVFKMLSLPKTYNYLSLLHRLGLLYSIFPELISMKGLTNRPYKYDLWRHSIKTVRYLEEVTGDLKKYLPDHTEPLSLYLYERIEGEINRKALLKFCALFHDIGKPETVTIEDKRLRFIGHQVVGSQIGLSISQRLRLSAKAQGIMEKVILHHLRPLLLASQKGVSSRAIHRFFRETEEDGAGILLLALADAKAKAEAEAKVKVEIKTRIEDVVALIKRMLDYYYGRYKEIRIEPLVRGGDLIEIFGLEPGPIFKKILDEIEVKRAEGKIKNRDEAIAYIRKGKHQ